MNGVEILIFLFLTLTANSLCQRIECHWEDEYLCGDQCLGLGNAAICICGNETMLFDDAMDYICCNEGSCTKDMDGNIKCHGWKQDWRIPCNGICKQESYMGETTIPCTDQKQCVKPTTMCLGVPVCHE